VVDFDVVARMSKAHPKVWAGKGRRGDLRDPIERRTVSPGHPSRKVGIPRYRLDVTSGPADLIQLGLDGGKPGVGPVVVGVPLREAVELGTEFLHDAEDEARRLLDVLGEAHQNPYYVRRQR
jgi:hypothetical protein